MLIITYIYKKAYILEGYGIAQNKVQGMVSFKTKSRVKSWLPRAGFAEEFCFFSSPRNFSVTTDCTVLRGTLLLEIDEVWHFL